MHARAKALTVLATMALTFAVLPTLGAAAAEPLADGSYDVTVGDAVYTLQVVDGVPIVDAVEGVEFQFRFDATGRVLDEFEVAVGDDAFEVEVAEDGSVSVDDGSTADDAERIERELLEVEEQQEVDEEPDADEEPEDETEEDGTHGELVSSVAKCAPSGKAAREAGLPNHGTFVRAVARGEAIEFEVDGTTHSADLTTPEGAAAFCALVDELLAAAEGAEADEPEAEEPETGTEAEAEAEAGQRSNGKGNANGNGKGRDNAPGQQKKNG